MMQIKIPVDIDVDWFGEPENELVTVDEVLKVVVEPKQDILDHEAGSLWDIMSAASCVIINYFLSITDQSLKSLR